jgi:hypothetical protein
VTSAEQYIYNCYLETSRKLNNKPFKYRKNFDNFEEKEEYVLVNKLSRFFSKYPNINIKDFFEAPYFVYNESFFDLKFFTTQKAIKSYTAYQNKFLPENPDHEQSIQKIKDSFEFIYNFCKLNNISFDQYINCVESNSKWHSFFIHLKNRNICLYPLFIFPNFDKILREYDKEIKEFVFGDTFQNINFYRTKYYSSSKAKRLCSIIYENLNLKLNSKT